MIFFFGIFGEYLAKKTKRDTNVHQNNMHAPVVLIVFIQLLSCVFIFYFLSFLAVHQETLVSPDHLLSDRSPNIEPLISRSELDKFKNC